MSIAVTAHEPEAVKLMREYNRKEKNSDEVIIELMKLVEKLSTRVENLEMRLNYSDRH